MIKRFKRAIYFSKAFTYLILEKLALQDAIRYLANDKIYKSFECRSLAEKWHDKFVIANQQFEELTRA